MPQPQALPENERIAWAAWASIVQIGPKKIELLRVAFPSLADAWKASDAELRKALQREGKVTEAIIAAHAKLDPQKNWQAITDAKVQVVTLLDDNYPALLKETHDAPAVLFVRGTLPPAEQTLLAVVGTRAFTDYGRQATDMLVQPLVKAGLGIVSGLALGIDGLAHEATLNAGGKTWAVMGTGVNLVYPPQHRDLAHRIVKEGGGLISEFPLGTTSLPHHFPLRNRIVAGMCTGTLVVEAGDKSGALLTAKLALDENREVFAIPGDISRSASAGTNKFIRLGATLVRGADDILVALNLAPVTDDRTVEKTSPPADNPEEQIVIQHLVSGAKHVDELSRLCDCDPSVITSTLVMLELKGRVHHLGGLTYRL
ncbi:MAG: DNA-processing protein DprA [Patescibacteria group bacterium]